MFSLTFFFPYLYVFLLFLLYHACHFFRIKPKNPQSFSKNRSVSKEGGKVTGNARKDIEERTGKSVITSKNVVDFSNLISDIIDNDFDKNE